jgi:hypothetical protein
VNPTDSDTIFERLTRQAFPRNLVDNLKVIFDNGGCSLDILRAFARNLKMASPSLGVPRPDLEAFVESLRGNVLLLIGRRRIGKSFTLPHLVLKTTSSSCYLDLSVPVQNKLSLGQFFGFVDSEAGELLALACNLRVSVLADEVQASSLPGQVKMFVENPQRKCTLFRLSIVMYGSHQTEVSKLASTALFHVQDVDVHHVPMPPMDLACRLLASNSHAPTESPDKMFHQLVMYLAAWDVDVAKLSGVAVRDLPEVVLAKVIQSGSLIKENNVLPDMLGSEHLNYLLEVASSKSNSGPKDKNEIGVDLQTFGFLSVDDCALPGVKAKDFELSYAPLIFLKRADYKENPSEAEVVAAIASGLGDVFEWIIHTKLRDRLLSHFDFPSLKMLHGNANRRPPLQCEVDGLVVDELQKKALFISLKMNTSKQNLEKSVFKHVLSFAAVPHKALVPCLIYPVLLSVHGDLPSVDGNNRWQTFLEGEDAKSNGNQVVQGALDNAKQLNIGPAVALNAGSLINQWVSGSF